MDVAVHGELYTYKYNALLLNITDDYIQMFNSNYRIERYYSCNQAAIIDKEASSNTFSIFFQTDRSFTHADVITSVPRSLASGLA